MADFSESGFDAASVLDSKDIKLKGWAIAGQTGRPHALTLALRTPLEVNDGWTMTVTLEHASKRANSTLGHFRLAVTDDPRAIELGQTPQPVAQALLLPPDKRTAAQTKLVSEHYLAVAPALGARCGRSPGPT